MLGSTASNQRRPAWLRRSPPVLDHRAIGPSEHRPAVDQLQAKSPLVHQSVMGTAQQHQVVQGGLPPVGPVVWPLRRVCTSTVTVTWGRSPPTVGRSELSRYRWGQLAQGVGPALGGGAQVPPSSRPKLGIDLGLKRCQDGLSSLRVELSLHPDHPGRVGQPRARRQVPVPAIGGAA